MSRDSLSFGEPSWSGSNEESWADKYRRFGEDWADKEGAAQLLEDCKSSVMAQRQVALGGDMPVNRAEQTVKASPEWVEYITNTVNARKAANLAKVQLEALKMQYNEWNNAEANARTEKRM